MNRHSHRAAEARARRKRTIACNNNLYSDYIRHLPKTPIDAPLHPGGVNYMVMFHDEWCRVYDSNNLADCNCEPTIARFVDPERRS